MKKAYLLVVAVMICGIISGCSLPFQLAADFAGDMAAAALKPNSSSSDVPVLSAPVIGKEMEKHQIGNYEIRMSDGYLGNKPSIMFSAYKNGQIAKGIAFDKKDDADMRMINDFNQMGETAKKQQIRDWFIKYSKLDLGPVEPEATEKTSAPAPSSPLNIPTPGFAPTLPAQPR